jgi:hypothetical protein
MPQSTENGNEQNHIRTLPTSRMHVSIPLVRGLRAINQPACR